VLAGDSSPRHVDEFHALPGQHGIDASQWTALLSDFLARDSYKQFKLYDDVLPALQTLAGHELRTGVNSNNDQIEQMVVQLAVAHHFEVVVSPLTYGIGKPEPEIFARTLQVMGVAPERTLYVGDSHNHDVVGARAAGITPVLIDRYALRLDVILGLTIAR
jgi:putative hydrolase of the HAD superfamily